MATDFSALTLEKLRASPPPDFLERDPFKIKQFYVDFYEAKTKKKLYASQPEMYMIEVLAYAYSTFSEGGQIGFLQNRAVWAEGAHLEEIGRNVSTHRLAATSASTTVRFTLNGPLTEQLTIERGTIVAADDFQFQTLDAVIIQQGELSAEVEIVAMSTGTIANGIEAGTIDTIISAIPTSLTVQNLTTTQGGAEIEDQERYRLRVINALERVSKAGPKRGYEELIKSVHQSIIDVDVRRTSPGYIQITPLADTGIASDELDAQILTTCDPETSVPMGDYISTQKATARIFDVALTIRVRPGTPTDFQTLVRAAVDYVFDIWAKKLGEQISPSEISATVKALDNVLDVAGPGFAFTDLPYNEFAQLGTYDLTIIEAPNV